MGKAVRRERLPIASPGPIAGGGSGGAGRVRAVGADVTRRYQTFTRRQDLRFKPHLHLPVVAKLVRHPAIVAAVSAALGLPSKLATRAAADRRQTPGLLLWSSDFNIKEPGSGGYFSAHQDATYTGLQPASQGLTVWLALSDPVDAAHGAMSFWAGSHQRGQLPHREAVGQDPLNMLSLGQQVDVDPAAVPAEVVAVRQGGEASLHHFHLVHSSAPNCGTNRRVGLALRYISANVRQTGPARELVTLVMGAKTEATMAGFDLEPVLPTERPPTEATLETGWAAHALAINREKKNYFAGAATDGYHV